MIFFLYFITIDSKQFSQKSPDFAVILILFTQILAFEPHFYNIELKNGIKIIRSKTHFLIG